MPGKKYYEVKKILDLREGSNGLEFLVRWAHFTPAADSWEPAENLKNCGDIIADFMDKQNKRSTRRSTRLSQANELTKFEELPPTTRSRRKTQETMVTRTTKSTHKTKSKGKGAGNMSVLDQDTSLHRYSTRSSSRQVDLSDDEDVVSSTKTLKSRRPISESKFRKEIGGVVASTPYSSVKPKKALGFDEYDIDEKVTITTTVQTRSTTDKKMDEEIMMGEADSDDDEVTKPKQQQQQQQQLQQQQEEEKSGASAPAPTTKCASWMAIGWKEVALATVLTGIGVVGYVCYVTDYCSFC